MNVVTPKLNMGNCRLHTYGTLEMAEVPRLPNVISATPNELMTTPRAKNAKRCGMSLAVQAAMLGRLGTALESPIKASVVSFILGFVLLCAVVVFRDHSLDLGKAIRGHNPPWMWIGGLLGAVVVLMTSWLSPQLGTGLTVLVVLIGQVTGGL